LSGVLLFPGAPDLSSAAIPLRCTCSEMPEVLRVGFNALKAAGREA
jgi:hypothetical protein